MKFSVILPTYNEANHITELINEIVKSLLKKKIEKFEIIIVDDNSDDNTVENVEESFKEKNYIRVINRKSKNKSLVESLNDGIQISSYENIIWMDADFQHPPKYISTFIDYIYEYDVIIFSRFIKGSKRYYNKNDEKVKNTNMSIILNFLCNRLLFNDITDYTSGFICIKRNVLPKKLIGFYGDYFINLISFCKKQKVKIIELPFNEEKRKHGISKTTSGNLSYIIKLFYYFLAVCKAWIKKR